MSNSASEQTRIAVRAATNVAAELLCGNAEPNSGMRPDFNSPEYMYERAALSAVLITRTSDQIVVADNSTLGYRFAGNIPANITTQSKLEDWLQEYAHTELDGLIETEQSLAAVAQRYQDLLTPTKPAGQPLSTEIRHEALLFDGAIADADAWLRVGSVAAAYHGKEFRPEHALPFLIEKLPTIQLSARNDMAMQNVRIAILEAANELGVFHNHQDAMDHKSRFMVLRAYVAERAGHLLPAQNFEELYKVEDNPLTGISLTERPEGFGEIKPSRPVSFACPASYHLPNPENSDRNSALHRLLRASLNAMAERNLFQESMAVQSAYVPDAFQRLTEKLMLAETTKKTIDTDTRTARILALGGIHSSMTRARQRLGN